MSHPVRIAAAAAHFGRDLDRGVEKALGIVAGAREGGIDLLVLPHGTLGGYLSDLDDPHADELPPALAVDAPEIAAVARAAGPMTVCLGFTEVDVVHGSPAWFSAAVCVSGDGVLGRHRKVHQPAGEAKVLSAGDGFAAFDTPAGRLGMLIDYDKTFPEASRSLALAGAHAIACLSAWPASITDRVSRLSADRQSRLFDLYDSSRAAENQVVWISSNQTGIQGNLRFLGQAKVVGPGGDVLARTGSKGGLAEVSLDVEHEVARARRTLHHLAERRPDAYRVDLPPR
ncbi:carbon-nitrogen hydrolase family protein [Kineococcus rubinsiae]|uniref:carbon-nitrogen hydrolase family protein n=1 Tax=Kineococcus rubinsiae TaxID=2609562 RepID=UPI001431C8AC|nr:carbon-nitrogen hydrolase family protein [Kineococcus rubinsiae]NIZ89682.1 carbon-nitrogen hydrolase family protein [Kineococcus rubinsiae]